jgi:hypothetical protein
MVKAMTAKPIMIPAMPAEKTTVKRQAQRKLLSAGGAREQRGRVKLVRKSPLARQPSRITLQIWGEELIYRNSGFRYYD